MVIKHCPETLCIRGTLDKQLLESPSRQRTRVDISTDFVLFNENLISIFLQPTY